MELDIPTWMMVLILLIIIIVVINFLSARSDAFSEEIRKSKVIEELPITKKDINKLFKKKKTSNTKRKYGDSFKSRKIDIGGYSVVCTGRSIQKRFRIEGLGKKVTSTGLVR